MTPAGTVRIAICDDSRTYLHALKRFLEHDRGLEVIASYTSADELIRGLDSDRPDLVTMDIEMPGLGGLEATERIMRGTSPVPIVVLSAHARRGSERAVAALAVGAVEAFPKSELRLTDAEGVLAHALRRRLKSLARARVRPLPPKRPAGRRPPTRKRPSGPVRAIGIGASTGGPQALAALLTELPASFPIPVLVVQHIAAGFTAGLVSWLARLAPLPVRLATTGLVADRGIFFAADDAHLVVDANLVLRLDRRTVAGRHRPAVDVLFNSMPKSLGAASAAVVLTGLGRDGADGTAAIVAAGGMVIAQDEDSSVVNGMPGSAVEAGAQLVLPLDEIAGALRSLKAAGR